MSRRNSGSVSMSLSKKIYLAIGSILFAFALVIAFIIVMLSTRGDEPGISVPRTGLLAEQMKVEALKASQSETRFLLHPGNEAVEEHKKAVSRLLSLSSQLGKTAQQAGNTKVISLSGQINASIQQMDSLFLELVRATEKKGYNTSSGLLKDLKNGEMHLEEIISRNDAGNLAVALMRIKYLEKEYLRQNKNGAQQNLNASIDDFTLILNDTRIEPAEAQALKKSIRDYKAALDRFEAASLATDDSALSATMHKQKKRQAGAMRLAMNSLESAINRISIPGVLATNLDIQQNIANYLLTGEGRYAQRANYKLAALKKMFTGSSILQENKNLIFKVADSFQNTFSALIKQDALISDLEARLNDSTSTVLSEINNITRSPAGTASIDPVATGIAGNSLVMIVAAAGLALIFLGLLVAVLLSRSISSPITGMTNIIQRMSTEGDLDIEIPESDNNEIGQLAGELNRLLSLQEKSFSESRKLSSELQEKRQFIEDIARDLHTNIEKTRITGAGISDSTASQIQLTSQINESINRLNEASGGISELLNQMQGNNAKLSSALEQITGSAGSKNESITAIRHATSRITDILTKNSAIAEQAKLLAMNASVKAAKAGSHGREFSLIADEIDQLAGLLEDIAQETDQFSSDLNTQVNGLEAKEEEDPLVKIHEAGRSFEETAGKLTDRADVFAASTGELIELTKSFAVSVDEMATKISQQETKYTTITESIEELLDATSSASGPSLIENADVNDFDDTALQKAVDEIALSTNEEEEEEDDDDEFNIQLDNNFEKEDMQETK